MDVIDAPYPYHKAVMESVTSDKYLCDLVPAFKRYHGLVMNEPFTMIIPRKPSVQKSVLVALENEIEIVPPQSRAAAVPTQFGRPPETGDMSIQLALMSIEFIVHHSSIMIRMIERFLEEGGIAANPNPENIFSLRELKEGLENFNISLGKVLACYTFLPTISQPPIEDIRQAITLVENVLQTLKSENLHESFVQRPITQDDMLCSILGLRAEMGCQLHDFGEEERAHETDEYLIKQMLEDIYEFLLDESSEDVESRFISRVFNEAKAQIGLFSELLNGFPTKNQQSVVYWGQRFIEKKFEYDILLNDNTRPLDPNSGDLIVDRTCRVSDGPRILDPDSGSITVNTTRRDTDGRELSETVRVPTTYAQKSQDIKAFISNVSDDKNVVFYHGTDAVSGRRIVENGIMLGKGNREQDFSDGYGFYVTENGQMAFEWARHGNFAPSAAVIAFKVPNDVLKDFKKLDLTDNEKWKKIINYNRCGQDQTRFDIPAELERDLEAADFVEGKKWQKVTGSNRETTEVWPRDDLNPQGDIQVCICTKRMAEAVGVVRNISVCFFEKKSLQ